ncbi:NAD(P)-dependent oxidoreductase [Actinomadura parmotrematis]|uniref:NAD(P)-dependent oxidoreductase n=1 Tax=Actinomadura parmotrematis TaxID=2864039 RepID=UPI0027E35E14|nr:NAD(P)-dependent oxidoreductase [Actinomadura parmotrematis]
MGAGRMGLPMVRQLCAAGHDVRALARSDAARHALEQEGVTSFSEAAPVATGADAVLVCVFTDEQVRDVCLSGPVLEEMPPGSVVVLHTTVSPGTVADVAERAGPRGIDVVDAAVSGGPHDIAAGRLTVFAGGPDTAMERVRPALEAYGDPVLHVGPAGTGVRVKLVNNALFAAHIGLLAEAVRLGTRLGVDERTLLGALPHGSGASRALAGAAARGSVEAFTTSVGGFLGKDIAVVRRAVAELGGDLGALGDALSAVPSGAGTRTR